MAEKLNLNNYKASGVYTVEVDESQNLSLPISTGRLVIGSSKKGPINSVVALSDSRSLSAIYGEIDTKLEKNGSYFHRTLGVALRQGPVYALNLLPISDTDLAHFATFNTESASNNSTWTPQLNSDSISHFYNTQKLWFADSMQVNKHKNLKLGDSYPATGNVDRDSNKILTIVNLSKKPVTIWTKIADVSGYDIKVKEYYALLGETNELPDFVHPDDYISDYFIEVIAVDGDWTDYIRLSKDPIYKQYFNESGIIISKINDFLSLREITVISQTTGCIIPDFKDLSENSASIDTLFNRKFTKTQLYLAIDTKKIDMMDLTNSTFQSGTSTEPIAEQRIDLIGHGFDELGETYSVDDGILVSDIASVKLIDLLNYRSPSSNVFYFELSAIDYESEYAAGETYIVKPSSGKTYIVATQNSKLYKAWQNGFIKGGNLLKYVTGPSDTPSTAYINTDGLLKTQTTGQIKYIEFTVYSDITLTNQVDVNYITVIDTEIPSSSPVFYLNIESQHIKNFKYNFDLLDTNFFQVTGQYLFKYTSPNQLILTLNPNLYGNTSKRETINPNYDAIRRSLIDEFIKPNQYIKANILTDDEGSPVERPRLLKIKTVQSRIITIPIGPSNTPTKVIQLTILTDIPIGQNILGISLADNTISVYKGVKNFISTLAGVYIPGTIIDETQLYPNGTSAQLNKILDYMFDSTNIAKTLADRETLEYRYIIDSYEGQISTASKQQLCQLAANHGKALAICNAPSFEQYERSVDPVFIDYTNNLILPEYISLGGNPNTNPEFTFGFATGEKNGIPISSYGAYFMPNLTIYENGKTKSIPPAMYVSNAFMKKYTSGNTFSIVAGKNGILTDPEISGIEYDLTDEDRAWLEPAGFNLIVRRKGFGTMIYSNNTAYFRVKSALNNIHVREALITIEKDIEKILMNFLYQWNDPVTRIRVKTLVKNYLQAVQDARGISTFDVIFDDSNNGVEVLENNAGIVDIIVNFPRGIHKFINRITITRANGQFASQSSGFTASF